MAKYRRKPVVHEDIEAIQFKEGMGEVWVVLYTGNMQDYEKEFSTKQEAIDFIEKDEGRNFVDEDDKGYEIIYEDPMAFIDNYHVEDGDYIITKKNGQKDFMDKDIFEKRYEMIEEDEPFRLTKPYPDTIITFEGANTVTYQKVKGTEDEYIKVDKINPKELGEILYMTNWNFNELKRNT